MKLLLNIPIEFTMINTKLQLMCPFSLCSKNLLNIVYSAAGIPTSDCVILML